MFSINMLNGLFDPIINWFSAFLYYICVGLYYILFLCVGKLVDIIQILFRKFAGIDDLSLAGQEGDIVLQFINSDIVQKVFWAMVVLAVVLLFVASFVAVIKTEFNKDGKNDKKKVIKNAFRGIVNFVAVPVVCVFGLIVGNALLRAIDGALTQNGNSLSMTSQIFAAGGYNANRVRSYETISENATTYPENSMAHYISEGYGNFGIFTEDTTGVVKQSIADKIDSAFANNLTVDLNNLTQDQKTLVYAGGGNGEYAYTYLNYFSLGAFPWGHTTFNGDEKVDGNKVVIIGYGSGVIQESTTKLTFSIYNIGLVSYYYNLSLVSYDYLIAGATLFFAAWVYLTTILGLIKRLFMLTTLFIISPPICALYPLDEGKALGSWRSEFVKQALSAYSVVIVMNIFFLLLPLMLQIEIIPFGTKVQFWDFGAGFVNYIARLLIIIAALLFFRDATKTIAGFIGSESAYDTGSGKSSLVASRAVGSALLAGHMIRAIARHKSKGGDSESGGGEPSQQDIDNTANNDAAGKFAGSTNIIDPKNSMYASNTNNLYTSGSENSNSLNEKGISDSASDNPYSFNAKGITDSASDSSYYTNTNEASNPSIRYEVSQEAFNPSRRSEVSQEASNPSKRSEVSQKAFNEAKQELNDEKLNVKEKNKTLKTQKKELNSQVKKATRSSIVNGLKYAGASFMAIATGAKIKDYKSLNKEHSEKQTKVAEDKVKVKKEIEGKQEDFNKQKKEIEDLKKDIKEQKKKVKVLKENAEAAKKEEEDFKKRVEKQKKE